MAATSLAGVRVIDLSHVIAGPAASLYLAALGADVLKVENPRSPDVFRFVDAGAGGEVGTAFASLNAGKQSLAIDLKNPRLRQVLLDLARDADVFVENFRPGTAERLGVHYEAVRSVNPRIVYLSISGYGRTGPWSEFGAYDQVVQALTGMMLVNGEEGAPPIKVGFPVVDIATGLLGALAVVAALHGRRASDAGAHLDVSLVRSALQLMRPLVARTLATGSDPARAGNRGFSGSPGAATMRCADGWLAVAANTMPQFRSLCAAIGLPTLADDPRLVTQNGRGSATNVVAVDHDQLSRRMQEAFRRCDARELEAELNAAGVPAARVRSPAEFLSELEAGGHFASVARPDAAASSVLGSGIVGLGEPDAAAVPPALGADTGRVLREAGFGTEEIVRLASEGAIHLGDAAFNAPKNRG